ERRARGVPELDDDGVEDEDEPRAENDHVGEGEPGRALLRNRDRLSEEYREQDEDRRPRPHSDRVQRHGVQRRIAAHEHGALCEAEHGPEYREEREERHRLAIRDSGDRGDARDREQGAGDRARAEAFLALGNREEKRGERNEREQRLAEAGVDPNERVVRAAERSSEDYDPVQERTDERASTGKLQLEDRDHRPEQRSCEREPKPGAPEWVELSIAEPNADRVPAREHRLYEERCKRDSVAGELHGRTLGASRTVEAGARSGGFRRVLATRPFQTSAVSSGSGSGERSLGGATFCSRAVTT